MNLQGSQIVDLQYFQNLKSAIEGAQTCAQLNALAAEASEAVAGAQAAISAELAKVQPLLDLLTAPEANLAKIVTYLKDLIDTLLTPMIRPTVTYAAQLAATAAELAAVASALQAAASRIPNCSVSFP